MRGKLPRGYIKYPRITFREIWKFRRQIIKDRDISKKMNLFNWFVFFN